MQQLLVGQTLVAGKTGNGGDVEMFAEFLPVTEGVPDILVDRSALASLVLAFDGSDPDMWGMERLVVLPVEDAWPLQSFSQPVAMTVTCGACGPDGGLAHFDGTGSFEIEFATWGRGKISEIDMRGGDGRAMQGEMNFNLYRADGNVLTDEDAKLRLVIGQDSINLASHVLTWRGTQGWLSGIFIGVPEAGSVDPGGIAGQFSGVDCVPACGVEN